MQNKKR